MRTIPFPHSLGTTFVAGGPIRSSGLQVLSRMLSFGRMGIVLTTQGTLREPFVSFSTMTIVYCGNIIRYYDLSIAYSIVNYLSGVTKCRKPSHSWLNQLDSLAQPDILRLGLYQSQPAQTQWPLAGCLGLAIAIWASPRWQNHCCSPWVYLQFSYKKHPAMISLSNRLVFHYFLLVFHHHDIFRCVPRYLVCFEGLVWFGMFRWEAMEVWFFTVAWSLIP